VACQNRCHLKCCQLGGALAARAEMVLQEVVQGDVEVGQELRRAVAGADAVRAMALQAAAETGLEAMAAA
jgi:hypothetical protein